MFFALALANFMNEDQPRCCVLLIDFHLSCERARETKHVQRTIVNFVAPYYVNHRAILK